MFTNRKRFRRDRPLNRISLNLSQNFDAVLNSIEEIDGESTSFSTVENLVITGTDNIKINIEFRLFFNVWVNYEEQNRDMVVDYESAEDIRIITDCRDDNKLLSLIEKIPTNENDIINLVLDDLIDNWEEVEIIHESSTLNNE